MNKLSRIVLMVALLLAFAVPLAAQLPGVGETTVNDGTNNPYYLDPPMEVATFGGHWYYCKAYGGWGEKCLVCEKVASTNKQTCIWASYSGRCECIQGATSCKMYGVCEYHTRS